MRLCSLEPGDFLRRRRFGLGCDPTAPAILKGYKRKYGKLPELGEDVMPDAEAEAADEVSSAGESSDSD